MIDVAKDSVDVHNTKTFFWLLANCPHQKGRKSRIGGGCRRCKKNAYHRLTRWGCILYSVSRRGGCPLLPFAVIGCKRGKPRAGGSGGRLYVGGCGWWMAGGNAEKSETARPRAGGGGRDMRFCFVLRKVFIIYNPPPNMFSLLLWILYYQLPLGAFRQIRFDRQGPQDPWRKRTA